VALGRRCVGRPVARSGEGRPGDALCRGKRPVGRRRAAAGSARLRHAGASASAEAVRGYGARRGGPS
jgi:hypothetical protein